MSQKSRWKDKIKVDEKQLFHT